MMNEASPKTDLAHRCAACWFTGDLRRVDGVPDSLSDRTASLQRLVARTVCIRSLATPGARCSLA